METKWPDTSSDYICENYRRSVTNNKICQNNFLMSFLLGLTDQKSKGHLHLKLVNFLFVYMFLQNTDNNHDLRLASARPKLVILRQFQNPQRWLEWQWNSLKCFKASDVHQAGNGKAEKQRKKNQGVPLHLDSRRSRGHFLSWVHHH